MLRPKAMTNFELSVRFFLQLAVIIAACRGVGLLARWVGQPQVVGEMIAGLILGPSLLGRVAPELQAWIFPRESLGILYAISQVGMALYMFMVGMEFEPGFVRSRLRSAAAVSAAGMIVPFALGCALVVGLAGLSLFAPDVSTAERMLFLGAAMSITAFPMLARIIYERGLANTPLGTLALAAGAIDDAAAWCILALVLASFGNEPSLALLAIGGGVIYTGAMIVLGRPALRLLDRAARRSGHVSSGLFSVVLVLVMFCSWVTDSIGIYAVFGAFVLGAVMPRGPLSRAITERLEPLVTSFLVPLFFVYSGLNTQIGLLDSPLLWAVTLLVVLAACLGKGVACWAAARLSGSSAYEALALGVLMNARGMMELIILNIGLERGIITPTLFAIMVLMAIATTLITVPLFDLISRRYQEPADVAAVPAGGVVP